MITGLIFSLTDGTLSISSKRGVATVPLVDLPAAAKNQLKMIAPDTHKWDALESPSATTCKTFTAKIQMTSPLYYLYLSELVPRDLV